VVKGAIYLIAGYDFS